MPGFKLYIGAVPILLLLSVTAAAQPIVPDNSEQGIVSIAFLHESSDASAGSIVTNVVRLVNASPTPHQVSLTITPPAGWQLISLIEPVITISANDSLYIPIRLKQQGAIKGNMSYVTNAFLSVRGITVSNALWYINISSLSSWYILPSANKVYFTETSDTASFSVTVTNNGNSDETIIVSASCETDLMLKNSKRELVSKIRQTLALPAGQDTVLAFAALNLRKKPDPNDLNNELDFNRSRIKIKAWSQNLNRPNQKSWTGTINFMELPNERAVEAARYESLPITVEWNNYNILSDYTHASINLYGNKIFKDNTKLTYYYQSSYVNNQLNLESFLGNYLYAGYFHKIFSVEVGDINSNYSGSVLSGKGIKASGKYQNHRAGALYISSPKIFDPGFQSGYGVSYGYKMTNLNASAYFQMADFAFRQVKDNFGAADVNYAINQNHKVHIGGGFSSESAYFESDEQPTTTGYMGKITYTGSHQDFNLYVNSFYSSPSFSPRRGIFSLHSILGYAINETMRARAGYSAYDSKNRTFITNELVTDSSYYLRDSYFLQLLNTQNGHNYSIRPEYSTFKSKQIDVNSGGVNLEYRTRIKREFTFFSTAFLGYNSFPSHGDIDDIFVANARIAIRYRKLNTNVRYYYGPHYLYEQIEYTKTVQNMQKIYAMLYSDFWFAKKKIQLHTNLNYFYSTNRKRHQMVFRPELFYYTKNGFRFSLYSNYLLYANGEYAQVPQESSIVVRQNQLVPAARTTNLEFGFGIKFNINAPISLQKNHSAKVIVFRDLNGNNIKDVNEEGFENMLIRLTQSDDAMVEAPTIMNQSENYELITDASGEAEYRHLPTGNYLIETIPLTTMGGWFESNSFYQLIDRKQTIYIPLSKGARLSGSIFVERDLYSDDKDIKLANIRVTAMNENTGQTQSTLTDYFGNYSIYLPSGEYIISINEGAVGSRFSFMENNIPLVIRDAGENYNVGFYLVEKQRKIKMGNGVSPNVRLKRNEESIPIRDQRESTAQADDNLLPVSPRLGDGKTWVVQLFFNEQERMAHTAFDSLKSITTVFCLKGEDGGFLYFSEPAGSKGKAKKLASKIQKAGFDEAKVVQVDYSKKKEEATEKVIATEPTSTVNLTLKSIETEADKALYRIQIDETPIQYSADDLKSHLNGIDVVYVYSEDLIFYYSVGAFNTEKEAKAYLKEFIKKYNTQESKIVQYNNIED